MNLKDVVTLNVVLCNVIILTQIQILPLNFTRFEQNHIWYNVGKNRQFTFFIHYISISINIKYYVG